MRLVIMGGGGFRVPLIHRALLARPELGVRELVLYDSNPERLAVIASVLPASELLDVHTSASLPNALYGADFVFSAIRVGGTVGRVRDERRALSLGVLGQETVGAGGLTYGLRTLPVALHAARTMAEVAPLAYLINFTNPAGMITEALRAVLGDRVIGICDSPIALIRRACRALGVPAAQVRADYVGINHLGWLRRLLHDGVDLLPRLLASDSALAGFEEGRLFGPSLLRQLGAIPNEYLYFYYRQHELRSSMQAAATRGEVVRDQQSHFYSAAAQSPDQAAVLWEQARTEREISYLAETRAADEDRDTADLAGGGYEEVALDVMAGLSGRGAATLIVNVANGKAVPQLPADMVLEVPAVVDAAGAAASPVEPLTLHQLGLISSVRSAERAIITAVETGSREAALWGLTSHPLVNSADVGAALLDDLSADEPGLTDLLR